jgi:ribosomal protein S27AE
VNIPEKIEVVQFICSSCGRRTIAIVFNERMSCGACKVKYERRGGEWNLLRWWKHLDKENKL